MIFNQGDTYELEIPLTTPSGEDLDINDVSIVEFTFDNIRKLYGEGGDVTYDNDLKLFRVPLSQQETFSLPENEIIKYKARVKFTDNHVDSTCVYNGYVEESLSKEVL